MKLYTRFGALFSATILATFLGACSDDSTSSSSENEIQSSATDSAGAGNSSSSIEPTSSAESSSSMLEGSSSSAGAALSHASEGVLFSWVGADDGSRAITGLDNGTETSGYWYWYNDKADGGNSRIEWPIEVEYEGDMLKPVIEACQGICGKFTLDQGDSEEEPFVEFGFNLAGTETLYGGSATTVDITAWGGLCVAYSSTTDIELYLSYGDNIDAAMGYDFPYVTFSASTEETVNCARWKQFSRGWGMDPHMEELVKKAASVQFRIQGKSGTTGEFNIMSVSSYVEQ
ncbi:hypothetical protein [uncultured Fibrobacter sp.]|uniref:hypothetical protein n=1 Tax=uncultured Fibrobacter sp. TaxID=261512 RepID=UPI0025E4CA64|nr:hypothetical protein [uncultured Fibrobacter sp.]